MDESTVKMIEDWCKEHNVTGYSINSDLTIDVNTDVDLSCQDIHELPFKFGIIHGDFSMYANCIENLHNFPEKVFGDVSVSEIAQLTSLFGAPKYIERDFYLCDVWIEDFTGIDKDMVVNGDIICDMYDHDISNQEFENHKNRLAQEYIQNNLGDVNLVKKKKKVKL